MNAGETIMTDTIIPLDRIERAILLIRGKKVMLDCDLADLYGVETKALNRAVRRHCRRFPSDFMSQLSADEFENLRCRFGTSSQWGGRRYLPCAFTEQGIAMLSGVLNSDRAIEVNITIMRAFVKLRELLVSHADLAKKIEELEVHYDEQFRIVFEAIRQLMKPPEPPSRKIGFDEIHEEAIPYKPLSS